MATEIKYVVEEVKFTEEQIKKIRGIEERHWTVVLRNGDEYEVHGTFTDVINLSNAVGEDPVYVSGKCRYPVSVKIRK